ncbi:MarR family winged helix-turn-helix transcriptional regulator [Streptomyces sp. URMC 123]|uniref:MarR family winged helix-turn-helix transcriptional regulator n=1 Tax=Streptomyces sp. URMC 123 TaxID=3423403 RepID=UPI003F19C5A7
MEYSHDDAGLARQPIGYWGWAASKAAITHIRAGLARLGVTQPQFWVLAQAAENEAGKTREELHAVLGGYLDIGSDLDPEIDGLIERKLLVRAGEDGRLALSAEGAELYGRLQEESARMRAVLHAGVSEEEYVGVVKALQRMIHNVDGSAWHH